MSAEDPGVYSSGSGLVVCGFSSGSPCKYTAQGRQGWEEMYTTIADQEAYQMAFSSKVGSVMLGP